MLSVMQLKLKGIMKKLLSKLRKKQPQEPAGRITTDTLAEHREKVLAGGRKFKYPVQYQRHKLVINALIIGVAAVLLLIGIGWYMLYSAQNTSEFMYRVTKVVPVPVATVDGEPVEYSDYLMKYRSAEHYLLEKEQIDGKSPDGKSQLGYVKSQAMDDAIADAYASKLARGLDVDVTSADLEAFLKQQRQSSDGEVSEATYNTVIRDYYGWSPSEYREAMKSKLLRQKVAYAVDKKAEGITRSIEDAVKAGNTDLKVIAEGFNAQTKDAVAYTPAAWVPKTNQDGGLAAAAAKLSKGQVSTAIKTTSGNGYYYVKLIDSNETQLQYEYIHVPLTEFSARLAQVAKDNKLAKFIKIEDITNQQQ
jgi:hypothetical protein